MQKLLDLQIDMHTNTQGVCNNNQALLATILVYVASKLKLDTNITSEKKLASLLDKLAKNSAVPKNLARMAAIPVFLDLSSNLSSFSWNKGDMKLYLEVKFTQTALKTVSDSEFIRICGNLLNVAEQYIDDLADRNITGQTLTDDGALLEDFVNQRQIFKDTTRQYHEVLVQLRKQVKTTNFDLKSMDTIIDSVSLNHPDVAGDYWRARNLPTPTGSKVVFKGKVFDSITGQPLPGANVTITPVEISAKALASTSGADLVKNVKVKSSEGGFQLKSLASGVYTVKVSYYGYAEQEVTVYINDGQLTSIQLPLIKLA